MPPKQVIKEQQVAAEDDTREWALERLKVLSRLSPWRLLRHFISTREPLDMDSYFDNFTCAALFIDISGFSMITEKLFAEYGLEGAEELAEHLNLNLGAICEHLTSAGGDIIKFAGDACLCVFAVDPSLSESEQQTQLIQHTLLATKLSLICITELEARNYTVLGTRLTAHSGIGCGKVSGFLAGGTFKRSEYAIIGEPITQIASAEPAAGNGQTVVSQDCWKLIARCCEGTAIVDDKDGNVLVHSMKPSFDTPLPHLPGISAEIEVLQKDEANLISEEIKQVVPGQIRQKLAEFTPTAVPTTSEFRLVTVLFIRLLGLDYTKGIPEFQKVQSTVRKIQDVIYKYEGCFSRFAVDDKGAVVLGVFGLPPAHHNDAELGCKAAIEFCQEIEAVGNGVSASVGITTGFAFSGLVGSQSNTSRCEYTTHGPLVNLAARLMCASRGILVDVATRDACKQIMSELNWQDAGKIKVKGKQEEVETFVPSVPDKKSRRLSCANSRQSMWDMNRASKEADRDSTPSPVAGKRRFSLAKQLFTNRNKGFPTQSIVGRLDEVKMMREIFTPYLPQNAAMAGAAKSSGMSTLARKRLNKKQAVKQRPPCMVFIEGTSGVGKTELSKEAIHIAEELQMTVIKCDADKVEATTTLYVFRNLMEALLDMEEEDYLKDRPTDQIEDDPRLAALESIFMYEHEHMDNLHLLSHVVSSVKFEETAVGGDDMLETLADLILFWIKCYAEESPLCIIFDDAQYVDPFSWKLLGRMLAVDRVVCVICRRPINNRELTTFLLGSRMCVNVDLQPMSKADIAKIFRVKWSNKSAWNPQAVQIVSLQEEIVDTIYEKAGGNPFHSEQLAETIKTLEDADGNSYLKIDHSTGECTLREGVNLGNVKFPEGLHGLITQKIDLLPGTVRKLLKWMAVLGLKVKFHMLQQVVTHADVRKLEGQDPLTGGGPDDKFTTELVEGLEILILQGLIHKAKTQQVAKMSLFDVIANKRSHESVTYEFSQLLTHEVSYKLNTYEEKKTIHKAAALVMEASWRTRGKKMMRDAVSQILKKDNAKRAEKFDARLLAYHWGMAGEPKNEVKYLELAGAKAIANYAHDEAQQIFKCIIDKVAESDQTWPAEQQAKWFSDLGFTQLEAGAADQAKLSLGDALRLYQFSLPSSEGMRDCITTVIQDADSDFVNCITEYKLESQQNCKELCAVFDMLSRLAFFMSDDNLRVYSCLMAFLCSKVAKTAAEVARGFGLATLAFASQDMHDLAVRYSGDAVEAAAALEADDPRSAMNVYVLSSLYRTDRGQWAVAAQGWERAAQIADKLGNRRRAEESRNMLGWASYNIGQFTEARVCYETGEASATKRGDAMMGMRLRIGAANCALALGNRPMLQRDVESLQERWAKVHDNTSSVNRVLRIQMQGLVAMLHILRKEDDKAYSAALAGAQDIIEIMAIGKPTQATAVTAYRNHCEAFIELWSRKMEAGITQPEDLSLQLLIFHTVSALTQFGDRFPGATPGVNIYRGCLEMARGNTEASIGWFEKASAAAHEMQMPFDEATAGMDQHMLLSYSPPAP